MTPRIGSRTLRRFCAAIAGVLVTSTAASADIASNGFLVRHDVAVAAPPQKVYDALMQVGAWWSPQHTYSGDAKNLAIDARPGGCFCERLPEGGVEHMRVVQVRPGQLLRLGGGLGPLQGSGVAGAMTWRMTAAEGGSRLELVYSVGGFIAGGFADIAPAVERVLGEQVDRLKRYAESGSLAPPK